MEFLHAYSQIFDEEEDEEFSSDNADNENRRDPIGWKEERWAKELGKGTLASKMHLTDILLQNKHSVGDDEQKNGHDSCVANASRVLGSWTEMFHKTK